MIKIDLEWHEWPVDLISLEKKFRNEQPSYIGSSAGSNLTLHFEDGSLTDNEIQDIKLWFKQDLDETEEATKRALPSRDRDASEALIKAEKEAILLIEDVTTLSAIQKKIWMSMDLTDDEVDSLAQ